MKKLTPVVLIFVCLLGRIFAQDTLKVNSFLEEIVKQFPDVRDLTLSPKEDEVYFTAQSYMGELSAIITVKSRKGKWEKPQVASFSGKFQDLEPFLSADGLKLYFVSNRPLTKNSADAKDYDIWYVERKTANDAWSEPVNLGAPVNSKENEFYPSLAKNGNLYFTCDGLTTKGKDDIFICKWNNGKYESPVNLGDSVNSGGAEFNAFVSADEKYLLYTCYKKEGGFGSGDLYISYKKENGEWTAPKNLGDKINSPQMEYCPLVKGNTLYFTSRRNFVNAKSKKAKTIDELRGEMSRYENGQSRLFKVVFSDLFRVR